MTKRYFLLYTYIKNFYKKKKCSRYNLTIDIKEIGLDDRIIAPKSFETGYCFGSCDYPLYKVFIIYLIIYLF
jgi:hypothetical protein